MTAVMTAVMTAAKTEARRAPRPVSTAVCDYADLVPDRGVCAMVDDRHVAVFRLSGTGEVVAVDNIDPFSGASVLSRGLVGAEVGGSSVSGSVYVASPLRRQRFDLRTGRCLDNPDISVDAFDVEVRNGVVVVGSPRTHRAATCTKHP